MKQVSAEFMKAIYADTRQTRVTVTFPFFDPDAKDAASINMAPTSAEIGDATQTIDGNYDLLGKVAQFEPNYWQLDGSFILPLPNHTSASQYGYWSEALSDSTRNYPANMVMRLYFSRPITIPGITILFDTLTNNYLTDFDCIAYNQDMVVLRREEVRRNTKAHFVLHKGVVAAKYIDLVFLKSNLPNRRVRITEIDFGIMLVFEGSNLLNANLISECDYMAETIPDNEFNFTAFNDGKFDYTNEESYSKYLQRRQQFEYRHNLVLPNGKAEHVDMGTYCLQSWKVTDSQISIKTTLDFSALEEHPFRRYSLNKKMTCGQLLELIFLDARWSNYEIEEYLYQSPTVVPYTGEVTNKEALRMVAQLAGACVFKMPGGKIVVKRIDLDVPPVTVDAIDYNNSFSRTQAKSGAYYNAISLTITTAAQKETPQNNPIVIFKGRPTQAGIIEEFIIGYDYILYDDNPSISISGTGSIVSYSLYANYAFVKVNATSEFSITIIGRTADFNSSADTLYYAPWYQDGEELRTYKLKLPMMMQGEQYSALRRWCVAERFRVLNYRLATESRWRQNPALDIGDYVDIQLDKSNERVPIITTKHTFSYKGGALSGTTNGIGQGQFTINQ